MTQNKQMTIEEAIALYEINESNSVFSYIEAGTLLAKTCKKLQEQIRQLREEKIELLETILLAESYPHATHKGWMHHSFMSDQEHALAELVKEGIYEFYSETSSLFRRKDSTK